MRAMKDSGVNWIGKFPNDWKAVRLKYLMNNLDWQRVPVDANKRAQDGDELYDYYGASGIIDKINGYTTEGRNILIGEDGANLVLRNLPLIYIAEGKYWVNNHAHILHPKDGHYLDFFAFQMEIIDYSLYITGSAQPKLSQANLNNVILAVPSQKEQNYIATYLQKRLFEINSTMSDLQHQIELLQEYKQSVITEAVTKGLDKNVAMKDSGIEWIGEIASNANIIRLKHFAYMKGRIGWQGLKSTDFIEEGPYCITGTDFINGQVNWDTCYHVSEERYQMDPYIQVKIGDLLITKDGTIGKMAIISDLPYKACLNSHLLLVRPLNNKFTNKYLYYVMLSDIFSHYYSLVSNGSTMDSLSQEKMGNFSFPIYDTNIQHTITNYLDKKCTEIDAVLTDKQKQLDTLTEYKKSLIYEYVTGKKEVPADA